MKNPAEPAAEQHPQNKKYVTNVSETLRKIDSGPSHPSGADDEKKAKQVPVDIVEEESMESFPASDPPSHSRANRPDARRPGQED